MDSLGEHWEENWDEFWDEDEEPVTDGPLRGAFVTIAGRSGVAWYIDADNGFGEIIAHMVGDDRRFTFDTDDATIIDDDAFCSGCGSTVCGHGR